MGNFAKLVRIIAVVHEGEKRQVMVKLHMRQIWHCSFKCEAKPPSVKKVTYYWCCKS